MKKTVSFFIVFLILIFQAVRFPAYAESGHYHWYCPHAKGHIQPTVGADVAFAEGEGAYFIDRRHASPEDADRVVYLTFDAGYENGNVAKILDILKAEEVPAAFFILGHLIKNDPALVTRMAREGHTVCNHTASHRDVAGMNDAEMLSELGTLEALYRERIGEEMAPYYRPPEGSFSKQNLVCARENGYTTVFWSFAYPDWDNKKQMSPEKAKEKIIENLHNGEVMLLHPTSDTNARILGEVIREIKRLGYRFGTLDELVGKED